MTVLYSGAQYRPLSSSGFPPALTTHNLVILHTMVGSLDGTDSYFKQNGWSGTESHFGVGGNYDKSGQDGLIYQWVPTDYKADANLDANDYAISIETSDGARDPVPAWSSKQFESIAQVTAWACRTYNIPAVLVPDSKPGRRGIAYHRQGIDPYRVSGGDSWSSSYGKICPGDARINQMPALVARVNEILNGDDDMPLSDDDIAKIVREVWQYTGANHTRDAYSFQVDQGGQAEEVLTIDGVIEAPDRVAASNSHWALNTYVKNQGEWTLQVRDYTQAGGPIQSKLDSLQADLDAIRDALDDGGTVIPDPCAEGRSVDATWRVLIFLALLAATVGIMLAIR